MFRWDHESWKGHATSDDSLEQSGFTKTKIVVSRGEHNMASWILGKLSTSQVFDVLRDFETLPALYTTIGLLSFHWDISQCGWLFSYLPTLLHLQAIRFWSTLILIILMIIVGRMSINIFRRNSVAISRSSRSTREVQSSQNFSTQIKWVVSAREKGRIQE